MIINEKNFSIPDGTHIKRGDVYWIEFGFNIDEEFGWTWGVWGGGWLGGVGVVGVCFVGCVLGVGGVCGRGGWGGGWGCVFCGVCLWVLDCFVVCFLVGFGFGCWGGCVWVVGVVLGVFWLVCGFFFVFLVFCLLCWLFGGFWFLYGFFLCFSPPGIVLRRGGNTAIVLPLSTQEPTNDQKKKVVGGIYVEIKKSLGIQEHDSMGQCLEFNSN